MIVAILFKAPWVKRLNQFFYGNDYAAQLLEGPMDTKFALQNFACRLVDPNLILSAPVHYYYTVN